MIAKVIVRDDDRAAAIARAIRALEELEVEGIPTTRELAIDILRSREFRGGDYSTSYLAEMEGRLPSIVRRMSRDGLVRRRPARAASSSRAAALASLVARAAEAVPGSTFAGRGAGSAWSSSDGRFASTLEV